MIEFSPELRISEQEYANQGNAILGIRDSGKSYTATWLAERLLDADIPFVAFDPIGVWRNLKLPGKGKGYEVVVAGDGGDLPLTPESAPEIVRAAMRGKHPAGHRPVLDDALQGGLEAHRRTVRTHPAF